jgi:hypothetical protein
MSPIFQSPTSPTFSKRPKSYNFALVEDPLLATLTAASYPTAPQSPDEELDAALAQAQGKEIPDSEAEEEEEDYLEELNTEVYDSASTSDQVPNHSEAHLVTHAKVYAIAEK